MITKTHTIAGYDSPDTRDAYQAEQLQAIADSRRLHRRRQRRALIQRRMLGTLAMVALITAGALLMLWANR